MNWEHKARIMRVCANLPAGDLLYKHIQKNFGRLNGDPTTRIQTQIDMAYWLRDCGLRIAGRRFFEVGTGHKPIIPIGLFLSGAESVATFDLNRRIDFDLKRKVLYWIRENRSAIEPGYLEFVEPSTFEERFDLVKRLWSQPESFLREANIQYLAPADAANTNLPDASIDCHFSASVMEHIPGNVVKQIFLEARRVLASNGMALHFIDPSDHFQHDCSSITKINFLRFSAGEWARIAGNEFAYCNRLRASDYLALFNELAFDVLRLETTVDDQSMRSLQNGFVIDEAFRSYQAEDICSTDLNVMLRKRQA